MCVSRGGETERGARARRLPAAAAAHLAGGVAPARGPRERRRRSARGAHAPTWAVPPGPGGTWRDRRDLDFWRDQKFKDAFLGGGGTTKVGFEAEQKRETRRHGNPRARRRRSAATGSKQSLQSSEAESDRSRQMLSLGSVGNSFSRRSAQQRVVITTTASWDGIIL